MCKTVERKTNSMELAKENNNNSNMRRNHYHHKADNSNNILSNRLIWSPQRSLLFWVMICLVLLCELKRMNEIVFSLTSPSAVASLAGGVDVSSSSSSSSLLSYQISNQNGYPSSTTAAAVSKQQDDDGRLKIVWLMSFPNSGTSYTAQLLKHTTHIKTGSNYGEENLNEDGLSLPIYDDVENGVDITSTPVWVDPLSTTHYETPSKYVLVKTHCGGRCGHCGPKSFLETTYSFKRKCLATKVAVPATINNTQLAQEQEDLKRQRFRRQTKAMIRGRHHRMLLNGTTTPATASSDTVLVSGQYDESLVSKAIHLYRNPFDNIVSRFHLSIEKYNLPITDENNVVPTNELMRQKFRAFCAELDEHYAPQMRDYVHLFNNAHDSVLLDELENVPCFIDFFRYIEWHNLANTITSQMDMNIPTYVLHYENYAINNATTVAQDLINFLEYNHVTLEKESVPPFKLGKEYSKEYYTENERRLIKNALQSMALGVTWGHIQHYFSSENEDEDNF